MTPAQRAALRAFLSGYDKAALTMTDAQLLALLASIKAGGT